MLKSVLTEQEFTALPEIVREHYKKQDSGNYLLEAAVREHPDTLSLRNAMVSEREQRETLEKTLKKFEGVNPDEIANLRREKELVTREKDLAAGRFEKALADATQDLNTKLALALSRADKAEARERDYKINDSALRAITDAGGNPKMLLPYVTSLSKLDDKGRVIINGEDGKPLMRRDWRSVDDFKPLSEFVEDLKNDPEMANAFKPVGAKGSNAQPTTTTATKTGAIVQEHGTNVWKS